MSRVAPDFPLRTARLLLRPVVEDDFERLYALYNHPDVIRFLYAKPTTREGFRERMDRLLAGRALDGDGGSLRLIMERADDGRFVGEVSVGYWAFEHHQGEIGYVLVPEACGHGFATEAAREMLRIGFEEAGMHRIIGRVEARNTPSARVLERLGMRREAHFVQNEFVKGEWTDEVVYAVLREEWLSSSGR